MSGLDEKCISFDQKLSIQIFYTTIDEGFASLLFYKVSAYTNELSRE